jgi:hypothetical protein
MDAAVVPVQIPCRIFALWLSCRSGGCKMKRQDFSALPFYMTQEELRLFFLPVWQLNQKKIEVKVPSVSIFL